MKRLAFSKPNWLHILSLLQILLLSLYLVLAIINIGENEGGGILLLAAFLLLSFVSLLIQAIKKSLVIRFHLFFVLLFVLWLALRVTVDLYDTQYLKQVTIATNGGILLFFFIGTFCNHALTMISKTKNSIISLKIILSAFFVMSFWVLASLQSRMLERDDIFFIKDVNDQYQRPGNFLIILFIIVSFSYLTISNRQFIKKKLSWLFWLIIYSISLIISLINSQMFGSNTATANLAAIYLITTVLSLLSFNESIFIFFSNGKIKSFLSRKALISIFKYSFLVVILAFIIAFTILRVTEFDLSKTRIFGFGSGENSSLSSRASIFKEEALDQLSYSPILGNANVAKITTGNSGEFLHNFIPNIIAELGLVGLLIITLILFSVFSILLKKIKNSSRDEKGFNKFIINMWLFFILLFLFFYANIAVEKSWAVIWFYIGFSVNVIYFKNRSSEKWII